MTDTAAAGITPSTNTASTLRLWFDRSLPKDVSLPAGFEQTADLEVADGAVVGAGRLWNAEVCASLPRLKVVARCGIGYDNVDTAACASVGVATFNAPDAPTVSTAEHTLALLLAVSKNLKPAEQRLVAGLGDYQASHGALELDNATLGLLGWGRIGSRVGRYAVALGMHVLTHDPHIDPAALDGSAVEQVGLSELWRRSEVVSLHAPASETTRHIVNAQSIAAMRSGVIIINCARGTLIDHAALLAGLESGHIAAAGLDVTEPEPLPGDHPLLGRANVIVTPHVASSTTVGLRRLMGDAIDRATAWLRGLDAPDLLNPAAADPAVDRRRIHPTT